MGNLIKSLLLLFYVFLITDAIGGISSAWDKKRAIGTSNLDDSSIFQVNSTTKGASPFPKMTTAQRVAISAPHNGLMTYDETLEIPYAFTSSWSQFILDTANQILTNKTFDADLNTLTNIDNANIKALAGISLAKLESATPFYASFFDASGFITGEQYLDKTRGGTGANNSAVTFPSSGTLVTETATQTLSDKTIDADLNTITNIENADIKALAGISLAKLESATPFYASFFDASGFLAAEQFLGKIRGGTGQDNSSVIFPASGTLVTASGSLFDNELTVTELAISPDAPSAGLKKIYCKDDDKCYTKNSSDTEIEIGAGAGGGFDNLLIDGDYEQAAASGENGLTCGTGNTCAQTDVAGEFANGAAGLKVTMGGSNSVSVKHCFANTGDAWLNRMAQVSASIKSTITDLQFCYNNNTTDEQCVPVGSATDFVKVIARSGVNSGEQICYNLKSTANPTVGAEIFIDTAKAGEFDIDGTTKVLKQSITHVLGGDSLLNRTGTVQFNSANLSNIGDSILTIDNTGDPTRFVCSKPKCYVDVSQSGFHGATGAQTGIYINGVKRINGSKTYTTSVQSTVSREFELNQNDYITIGDDDVLNNSNPYDLGIVATAYEQANVLSDNGMETTKTGNIFSAKVSSDGNISDENHSGWVSTCAKALPTSGASRYSCPIDIGATLAPNCSATVNSSVSTSLIRDKYNIRYAVANSSGTSIQFWVDTDNGVFGTGVLDFVITCQKQGVDYNKNQTIIGTFGAAVNSTIVHLKDGILTPATQRNPVNYDTVIYDPDNNFNIATDEYTIPEDGVYVFQAGILVNTMASSTYGEIDIFNSTTGNTLGISTDTDGGDIVGHRRVVTVTHYGTKGHTIRVRVFTGVNHVIPATTNEFMFFSATKVDQAGVINKKADLERRCNLTVTGTGWTTRTNGAIGKPYQDREGNWWLGFNISGDVTSGVRTSYTVAIAGVTSLLSSGIGAWAPATGAYTILAQFSSGTGNIEIDHASATTTNYRFFGDIPLSAKPTISGCDL